MVQEPVGKDADGAKRVSLIQRVCVLGAAVVAVGASVLQATGALGMTPDEFARAGSGTVRAASYAFAIWGLIYGWLLVYAAYQLVPGWASVATLRRFGWPSVIAMVAIGAWLVAAGADWRWATVALIALAAASLIVVLTSPVDHLTRRDRLLVVTPLALLAGWLTIATGLNAITVLTAEGFVRPEVGTAWALGGLTASMAVTLVVFRRGRVLAYPLPVIWGLVAVFIAERGDRPAVAWFAVVGAVLIGVVVIGRMSRGGAPNRTADVVRTAGRPEAATR